MMIQFQKIDRIRVQISLYVILKTALGFVKKCYIGKTTDFSTSLGWLGKLLKKVFAAKV